MKVKDTFYVRVPYFSISNYKKFLDMNYYELIDFCEKNFLETLTIESESLYMSLKEKKEKGEQIAISVYKYLLRSMTRTTPHGLSVRVVEGNFEEKELCLIKTASDYKTIELDFEWCLGLLKKVEDKYFNDLKVILNNHIEIGEDFVFNDWIDSCNTNKETKINVILDKKKPLEEVINLTQNKRITIHTIKNHLIKLYPQISEKQVDLFLRELLDNQIIFSDLKVNMLESRTVDWLIRKIESYEKQGILLEKLNELDIMIQTYENQNINNSVKLLENIINLMKSIHKNNNYLYINMYNPSHLYMSNIVKKDIEDYVRFLNTIALGNKKPDSYYYKFIDKFGFQAVNIKTVIDSIVGIGLPETNKIQDNIYYQKIKDYIYSKEDDEIDLSYIFNTNNQYTKSKLKEFELAFKIYQKNNIHYYEVTPVTGSNQMYKMLGRFKSIKKDKNNILPYDEVEVIYYPKIEKIGNVLSCTTNANHVLEYGNSLISNKEKVALEDIYVFPENDKLILINKRTNRRVKFINTNMTSLAFMPDILNALVNISNRYEPDPFTIQLILQDIFNGCSYQPKIMYKNFILKEKTLELSKERKSVEEQINKIKTKLHKNIVLCGIRDNLLLLDLDQEMHKKILNKMFEQYEKVRIQNTDAYDYTIIEDQNKDKYIGEYIFEIYDEEEIFRSPVNYQISYLPKEYKRSDEKWLSFKLYMPTAYMNKFLMDSLDFFMENLMKEQKIKNFFYIRYLDDEHHLRIRVLVDNKLVGNVFEKCYSFFNYHEKSGYIKRIILDEYIPEIVRYGGKNNIEFVENIFGISSLYCIQEIKKKKEKKQLYKNYILFTCVISLSLEYDFNKILDEFYKFSSFYKRNELTDQIKKQIINLKKGKELIKNLFDVEEMILIDKLVVAINRMIIDKTIYYDELPKILISIFHMHFNRLIGIDRQTENKLNGCTENILYTIKCVSKSINFISNKN